MKVLNDRKVILVILIIVGILGIIFVCNSITGRKTALDEVKLKENNQISKGIAIMLENDSNDGNMQKVKVVCGHHQQIIDSIKNYLVV